MATTKEIKNRIKSVKDTQKITNAMYLISSTKMRKAKKDLEGTAPYFNLLRREIRRIFSQEHGINSIYMAREGVNKSPTDRYGILVITADKGLAGAYNQNVIKEALRLMDTSFSSRLFVVGEYGRHYFKAHGYDIEQSFLYTAQNPSLDRARDIMECMLNGFVSGNYNRIYVCYTEFKNGFTGGVATHMRIFPFDKDDFMEEEEFIEEKEQYADEGEGYKASGFTFEPDASTVLDSIIPSYFSGFIYSALVESFCSEQNARMTAMDAANDNAQELLNQLSLEYNHVRQGAITQEITEISSGARGQRMAADKKKRKLLDSQCHEQYEGEK